jgi:hypothetical protein
VPGTITTKSLSRLSGPGLSVVEADGSRELCSWKSKPSSSNKGVAVYGSHVGWNLLIGAGTRKLSPMSRLTRLVSRLSACSLAIGVGGRNDGKLSEGRASS